jgi:ABC-type lipoprotein export system ATPase subunit
MGRLGKNLGSTIIMATHDREIIDMADLAITLQDGKIAAEVK